MGKMRGLLAAVGWFLMIVGFSVGLPLINSREFEMNVFLLWVFIVMLGIILDATCSRRN